MGVVKVYPADEARETILRRSPWETQAMPEALLAGIERIFGQPLTPSEAVAVILNDVRARGDAALHEWSRRIDGSSPARLEVPKQKRGSRHTIALDACAA